MMEKRTKEEYAQFIRESCDFGVVHEKCESNLQEVEDGVVGLDFLGTVFTIYPSGKYYETFACSNVSKEEAEEDEKFRDALYEVFNENGLDIVHGDGDPCDIFAIKKIK